MHFLLKKNSLFHDNKDLISQQFNENFLRNRLFIYEIAKACLIEKVNLNTIDFIFLLQKFAYL